MQYRTDIESYSECLESGGIFTTELELESFMIDLMFPLMAVWQCSAPLVRRWISTYRLKLNGKPMTGKHKHYVFLSLPVTMTWHRLLYRPQLLVDGNMKLVHLIMKRPEADVSLSDGELFAVRRAPYMKHLAVAPERQPVSLSKTFVNYQADRIQEIEM